MATAMKDVLERAIRSFNDPTRREDYFELYAPEIVIHGYAGVEPGIDSVRAFYRAFWQAFPDVSLTLDNVIAEGDRLACTFHIEGTHGGDFLGIAPTGRPIAFDGVTLFRFVAGRCVERWSQADFLGVLQQLGALPAAG